MINWVTCVWAAELWGRWACPRLWSDQRWSSSPPPDGRYQAESSAPGPGGWHLRDSSRAREGRVWCQDNVSAVLLAHFSLPAIWNLFLSGPLIYFSAARSKIATRRRSLPCVMVRRSSSRLRKDREATWGFPQRSVSSSTSSSNLIQRARSFQRISWSFSTISSFSSTNSWGGKHIQGTEAVAQRRCSDWRLQALCPRVLAFSSYFTSMKVIFLGFYKFCLCADESMQWCLYILYCEGRACCKPRGFSYLLLSSSSSGCSGVWSYC